MKELDSFNSRFDAGFLTQILEEKKIPYIVQANDGGGMFPTNVEFDAVKVFVSDDDFEKALFLLEE